MHRLLIFSVLGLAACPGATESKDGAEVFATICANCHGPDGKPPADKAAQGVRDLTSADFRKRSTPELVEHQVRAGSQNKMMPAFEGALREDQIKAVAQYVAARFH